MPAKKISCKPSKKPGNTSKSSTKVEIQYDLRRTARRRNDPSNPDGPHLDAGRNCPAPTRKNPKGERVGLGLWFDRPHYDLSKEEMTTGQGHKDLVVTCNMFHEDAIELRYEESDNLELSSDWKECTGSSMKEAYLLGPSVASSKRIFFLRW